MYKCQRCSCEFVPKDLSPKHLQRNPPRYCSRACAQPNRKTRVKLTCRVCSRQFDRKAYMAEWSKERGPFCGFDCYATWQSENTVGQANPNHRPDSNDRGALRWLEVRHAALERDGHRCRDCGSSNILHVHHLDENPNNHVLDNLLTVCAGCHRRRHPLPRDANQRFQRIP